MTPRKKEQDRDTDAAVADGGGAGEPAAEEGAPAASEGAVAEVVAPADGTDAADAGAVSPDVLAAAEVLVHDPDPSPTPEPSSWDRLAQRQS